MTGPKAKLAAVAIGLVALVGAGAAWAQAAPTIQRSFASSLGPHDEYLNVEAMAYGAPTHAWFELSQRPDMANAARVADERDGPSDPHYGRQFHGKLDGLQPGQTYYFRAHVQTPFGAAVGSVESFRTASLSSIVVPTFEFSANRYFEWNSMKGHMIDINVDAHGAPARVWATWSTDPSMAGAQTVRDPQSYDTGGVVQIGAEGQQIHAFLVADRYPANKTIYVQLIAENSAGRAKSGIYSFQNLTPNDDY